MYYILTFYIYFQKEFFHATDADLMFNTFLINISRSMHIRENVHGFFIYAIAVAELSFPLNIQDDSNISRKPYSNA